MQTQLISQNSDSSPDSQLPDKPVRVAVNVQFNAVQALTIERLLESGVYGDTRQEVIRRIVDFYIIYLTRTSIGETNARNGKFRRA